MSQNSQSYGRVPMSGNIENPDIILMSVNAGFIHASLGLRVLMANLGHLQDWACIVEGTRRIGISQLAQVVIDLSPRIIGISVNIWNHHESLQLTAALRQGLPDVWIVLGGSEASYLEAQHSLFTHADVVVRGEGEGVFPDICSQILSGEKTREGSCEIIEGGQVAVADFQLPYALLNQRDVESRLIYLETSRGCPFSCEFCLSSVQGRVREFPLERVLEQVQRLYHRGGRYFKVIDRTFNLDISRARRTLEVFLKLLSSGQNPGAYVQFEVVPDRLPRELRELLAAFPPGTLRLEVGIQTFNNRVAERINRRQDQERTLDNLYYLSHHTNATIHADLIIGLPGEDLESFAQGFDRLWQLQPGELQLGVLKALPGTTLHRHDGPWGMEYYPEPPYEIMQTGCISRTTMDELKIAAKFWELVVNRGKYPRAVEELLPPQNGAFQKFLDLSRYLYHWLGKTWGIDASQLGELLQDYGQAEIYRTHKTNYGGKI